MRVFNCGADWVTLTAAEPADRLSVLEQLFDGIALHTEDWGAHGYNGQACTETKCKYGSRGVTEGRREEIFISSGPFSAQAIDALPQRHALRCTRLDLQVTVYLQEPDLRLASDLYHAIEESRDKGNCIVGRRKASLVQSGTGETLYVGSRSGGRRFFRFYDKSHDYDCERGMAWRMEITYGRRFAPGALFVYEGWDFYDRRGKTVALVGNEFREAMDLELLPRPDDTEEEVPELKASPSGIQSKLKWLRRCVRPVVQTLVMAGYPNEVIEAVGLEKGWENLTEK